MKISKQGMMTRKEEEAHLHMPCPVCGKLNIPYGYMDSWILTHRRKLLYCCLDTHIQQWDEKDTRRESVLLGFDTIKGCESKWETVVNCKTEFLKSNLHLTKDQVHELTKFIGNDDMMLREEIKEIQTLYWNSHCNQKGPNHSFKKCLKNQYVKFLKCVVKICNK